jgi:hypothetical protein
MLPPSPRWTPWALATLAIIAMVLILCLAVATRVTDVVIRNALGKIYFYGTCIWTLAFVAVCLVSIVVRIRRHFGS